MSTATQPTNEIPTDYASRKARFAELTDLLVDREADVKETKSDLAWLMPLLRDDMQKLKEQNYNMDGRTYYLGRQLVVNKGGDTTTQEICDVLEANGFGHLVSRNASYVPATLKSSVKELIDNDQLPPDLSEVLFISDQKVIKSRSS